MIKRTRRVLIVGNINCDATGLDISSKREPRLFKEVGVLTKEPLLTKRFRFLPNLLHFLHLLALLHLLDPHHQQERQN